MSDYETVPAATSANPMRPLGGLSLEIAILIFCGAIISETGKTAGPVFDVVGPDFLPTVVALLVATLTLLQVVVHVVQRRNTPTPAETQGVRIGAVVSGVVFSAVTIAYVAVLALEVAPFFLATTVFVGATTSLLSRPFTWRDIAFGLAIGLVLGVGLQYVFTQVLIIDLPT